MELVYAVIFAIAGVDPSSGGMILQDLNKTTTMPVSECLKQAREINYTPDLGYVMLCTPVKDAPVEG